MYVVCLLFYAIGGGWLILYFNRSRLRDRAYIAPVLTSRRGDGIWIANAVRS